MCSQSIESSQGDRFSQETEPRTLIDLAYISSHVLYLKKEFKKMEPKMIQNATWGPQHVLQRNTSNNRVNMEPWK